MEKQIFDYKTKHLAYKTPNGVLFDLKFRGRVSDIRGESATGKTYLTSLLTSLSGSSTSLSSYNSSDISTSNIFVADKNISVAQLKELKEYLVVIDRAELILQNRNEVIDFIRLDNKNIYLIFSRKDLGLNLTPNNVCEFVKDGNVVTISYKYSVKGWGY